jgi:hypothetical protein
VLAQKDLPRLPGSLIAAVATGLAEARSQGYAPLSLHSAVPKVPPGLAAGSPAHLRQPLHSRWAMQSLQCLISICSCGSYSGRFPCSIAKTGPGILMLSRSL